MEFAAAFAYRDHAVRNQAVIEDGVAFVENIHVASDLYFEGALDDNVKLLTIVRVELHRRVLFFGKIREFYEEGLGKLFLKLGRKVVVFNTVLFQNLEAFSLSRDGERSKRRAPAFKQINDFNAASFRALINKSKTEVRVALFQNTVFFNRNAGKFGKFRLRKTFCFAQVFDSACNFFQTVIHFSVSSHF